MYEEDPRRWAEAIFGSAALGDPRRTRRLVDYAANEAAASARSTSGACRGNAGSAQGAYKLLRNPRVDPEAIGEAGFQAVVEECSRCKVLLALEDSSTLGYRHSASKKLGGLGGKTDAKTRGFWVHSVLMVDADSGGTIGLAHQQRWIRGGSEEEEEVESRKWRYASECLADRFGERMRYVISVCDREADIYEYLSFKASMGQRFVVRAASDRALSGEGRLLWDTVASASALGTVETQLAQRGGRQARSLRTAKLELRAVEVTLARPKYKGQSVAESVRVWAVHAKEVGSQDVEPLEWMLLTTEPAPDLESARKVLGYYRLRWRIEDFHKAWKSGTGIEDRLLQTPENLDRLAVVLAFVAVRMLRLHELKLNSPASSCEEVLETDEWRILWLMTEKDPPPRQAPDVDWAYRRIAKLGGWLDTKRTGRAGWEALSKGFLRLQELVTGYRLAASTSAIPTSD